MKNFPVYFKKKIPRKNKPSSNNKKTIYKAKLSQSSKKKCSLILISTSPPVNNSRNPSIDRFMTYCSTKTKHSFPTNISPTIKSFSTGFYKPTQVKSPSLMTFSPIGHLPLLHYPSRLSPKRNISLWESRLERIRLWECLKMGIIRC